MSPFFVRLNWTIPHITIHLKVYFHPRIAWACTHLQQLVEAYIYTHMHINPHWIYWLYKISWLSDINFTVFVLQIIILNGLPRQQSRYCIVESSTILMQQNMSQMCMWVGLAEARCVERPPLGVHRVQSEQWGDVKHWLHFSLHIYAYSERREIDPWFIIPPFLWNMHWNVNEYNKFVFNCLHGN